MHASDWIAIGAIAVAIGSLGLEWRRRSNDAGNERRRAARDEERDRTVAELRKEQTRVLDRIATVMEGAAPRPPPDFERGGTAPRPVLRARITAAGAKGRRQLIVTNRGPGAASLRGVAVAKEDDCMIRTGIDENNPPLLLEGETFPIMFVATGSTPPTVNVQLVWADDGGLNSSGQVVAVP